MNLLEFKKNVFSQNGEDGILEYIFEKLSDLLPSEKWCVEFGAWDGKHLSNTFNLVKKDWNAVYIEGDSEKYNDLLKTTESYPKIVPINAMVGFEESDTNKLDNLLERTKIPKDFELLSIDIDSFDLAVWQTFSGKPKVVVIEINSSIMPGILQWHDGLRRQGNSFSSTLEVATKKGYRLVCHTGNLIFVREDLVGRIGIDERSLLHPETLFLADWLKKEKDTFSEKLKRMVPSKLKTSLRSFVS